MNQYEPVIIWELTRAAFSIAAWWVLFCHLHQPVALWRRIALLVAMPAAYIFWILTPMSVLGNGVSWALFPILFAFLSGDLRRSLFTAFFYIGMEASIDNTRSSLIALVFGHYLKAYSPGYYLQYNLEYLLVFVASLYYCNIMKRYAAKPPFSAWILTIIPPFGLWAILTLFAVIGDPLLTEQGINIYLPGVCFGIFSIFCNLGVFYVHTRTLIQSDAQALAMRVSDTPPLWTKETGVSEAFITKYEFSPRQKDVIELMLMGKTNKEIAIDLEISEATVKMHTSDIYHRASVSGRFALQSLLNT
jgi:DNA-binding CsgD family transcriptional regulator